MRSYLRSIIYNQPSTCIIPPCCWCSCKHRPKKGGSTTAQQLRRSGGLKPIEFSAVHRGHFFLVSLFLLSFFFRVPFSTLLTYMSSFDNFSTTKKNKKHLENDVGEALLLADGRMLRLCSLDSQGATRLFLRTKHQ